MKLLLFICLVVLSGAHSFRPGITDLKVGNAIDDLVRAALESIRKALKEQEPLGVSGIPVQQINDPEGRIFVTAVLTESYISKAENFVIDHIENNLLGLWAKFGLYLPELEFDTKFTINGTALDRAVSGQGSIQSIVKSMVANGFVQLKAVDNYLQIDDLTINYTIQGLKFHEEGLMVEGMTPEEVQELFGPTILKFFQENEPLVAGKIARQVKIEANQLMKGKSLQQLIDMLKNFINPTSSP